jgi:HSP20 family protein
MTDLANNSIASKAFLVDVEDKGDGYEVKAYLTGVAKDDIDVELNEGRLSISVNVVEDEENEGKNFLQKEFSSYSATRGVYLKDASSEGLSAKYADGILTVTVPKIVEKKNVTKISID